MINFIGNTPEGGYKYSFEFELSDVIEQLSFDLNRYGIDLKSSLIQEMMNEIKKIEYSFEKKNLKLTDFL